MIEHLVKFQVVDLMGVAGATIGVIIANAILLSTLSANYVAIAGSYHAFSSEYRSGGFSEQRGTSLREQICLYKKRIDCARRGCSILCVALLVFLIAVSCASLGVIFPAVVAIKILCALTLFLGLFLMGCAAALMLMETQLSQRSIASETTDLGGLDTK
jgi:hypothetical protein